jgi:hypothetical protein
VRQVRALLPPLLAVGLLAGCGTDPADDRRAQVAALTEAANDRDAAAVRERAAALLDLLEAQRSREELTAQEADALTTLVEAVRTGADVIDTELLERRQAEAEAEAAKRELEQARQQLEEERKRADEAARQAAERAGEGKREGKRDKDEDKDD